MSSSIHPTAIIDPTATLGQAVEIGPYCIVGPDTHIGDETVLGPHVVVQAYTTLGRACRVSTGAVLGGLPQDLRFGGEVSYLVLGDRVRVGEYVTLHRATGEGQTTLIGNDCMLMAYAHVAHNCRVGNHVIIANSAQIAGHVTIGDNAFIGGVTAIQQKVRIGRLAILGGFSATRQDIPPFSLAEGRIAQLRGINRVALKRNGFQEAERRRLAQAFQYLFFSPELNVSQAIETIRAEIPPDPHIDELIAFIQATGLGIRKHHDAVVRPEAEGIMV